MTVKWHGHSIVIIPTSIIIFQNRCYGEMLQISQLVYAKKKKRKTYLERHIVQPKDEYSQNG